MTDTLLLDQSYRPLHVIPIRRALCLVLADKAEVVEEGDDVWRSARAEIPVPKVIRLLYAVKIPYRARIPLNRRAVLARDKGKCAYCGGHASTIDHVQPRSRGGAHRWENVVASCSPCNARKDDRLLSELGPQWKLRFKPFAPTGVRWLILGIATLDPAWEPYLAVA